MRKKNVRFEDNTETDGDDFKEYDYVGHIELLNKYVISGRYYENWDYEFVDKISGEITSFVDYPYISPDGKYLICIAANPYESTADMELWQIVNKNPKLLMSASFSNWMPAGENNEIFWSRDGYLYLPVLHSKAFWTENSDLNKKYQYIRIKVRI